MKRSLPAILTLSVLVAGCGSSAGSSKGAFRPRPGEPPPGACEAAEENLPEGTELVARLKPFPKAPRDGSRRGYACVLATIDVRGEVTEVKLLSHDNIRFGEEFRATVRRWRFDPILVNGVPTEIRTVFTAHFQRHL